MSSGASSNHSDDASTAPDELTFDLQVVSPSVGVTRPLLFNAIPATTTIKDLKDKIRQSLPLQPSDEQQRLIHRGRALVRETDTMLSIFGEEALRSGEPHTMHLVLREGAANHPPSTAAARGPSPASAPAAVMPAPSQSQTSLRQVSPSSNLGPQPAPAFPRRSPSQPTANPSPAAVNTPLGHHPHPDSMASIHQQHAALHNHHHHHHQHQHQHHQHMPTWLSQLQRETIMNRAMVNQNQRTRASMGMRGIGDNSQETSSGRASPALGHYYRETIGPNGQVYQVETVVRGPPGTSSQSIGGGLTSAEVQHILRSADLAQLPSAMNHSLHRSASNTSLHNRFVNTGPVVSSQMSSESRAGSGRATPDPAAHSAQGGHQGTASGTTTTTTTTGQTPLRSGVDVYILSSPEGPRAILLNNTTSETYYSPRLRTQASHPRLRNFASPIGPAPDFSIPPRAEENLQPHLQPQQPNQQPQAQAQNAEPAPVGEGLGHPHNPQPGFPALLVRIWPHLWLIFRLAVFVWLFTTPNASWSRWLSVIGLAVLIFVLSIGVFTNAAEMAWRPFAQQLENMLPRLEPQQQRHDQQGQGQEGAPDQQHGGNAGQRNRAPNPAEMAARLVAQRREREGWLQGQLRRVERASLLFLASLAPGVAERHIANMEAEAQAERQRVEAEAAAAAAAEAARQAEASGNGGAEDGAQSAAATLPEAEGHGGRQDGEQPGAHLGGENQPVAV